MDTEENKRNKVMLLVIGISLLLIMVVGSTYAYFTANVRGAGNNKVEVKTNALASATMDYGEKIEADGILPGKKIVKTIHVTGSGPENAKPIIATIILTPNVTDFGSHIKYTIYEVEKSTIKASSICGESKPTIEEGKYYDAMECDTTSLGTPILEGRFEGKKVVTKEIEVESTTDKTYYVVIEYENEGDQDNEQGKTFTINLGFKDIYEGPSINYKYIKEGEEVIELPEKNPSYEVSVSCEDEITREWDYENWKLEVEEELKESTTCTITFNKSLSKYLESIGETTGELAYDETADNNLRYIGANPNNYVSFNNELWRIIGVMNNIEDSEGNKGSRIKIIKNGRIGPGQYAWSGSRSTNWSTATLQTYLNGEYYNNLTEEAKGMIDSVVWNLGGRADNKVTVSTFYTAERGTETYNGNPTTWTGKIALIYPSDYGFAVGENVRDACLEDGFYNNNNYRCSKNNWINETESDFWTITALSNIDRFFYVYTSNSQPLSSSNTTFHNPQKYVLPSLYLNSNVSIESGTGSSTDPFILKAS